MNEQPSPELSPTERYLNWVNESCHKLDNEPERREPMLWIMRQDEAVAHEIKRQG